MKLYTKKDGTFAGYYPDNVSSAPNFKLLPTKGKKAVVMPDGSVMITSKKEKIKHGVELDPRAELLPQFTKEEKIKYISYVLSDGGFNDEQSLTLSKILCGV